MILFIRFILISLIIYLIVRSFSRYNETVGEKRQQSAPENKDPKNDRKISKRVGEYVDYEEVDE
jgi:large-conductance mechanosensitive channel